jgi:DNA polymerase I
LNVVTAIQDLRAFIVDLAKVDTIYLDTETSGLDPFTCKLYIVSMLVNNHSYVFDCTKFKNIDYIIGLISEKLIVGHNISFDLEVLYAKTGVLLKHVFCTMMGEVLPFQGLNTNNKYPSLAYVANKYCFVILDKETRADFYTDENLVLGQEHYIYASADVKFLPDIMKEEIKNIEKTKQEKVWDLEMRLLPVVVSMKINGILLDIEPWRKLMEDALSKAKELSQTLKETIVERLDLSRYTSLYELCEVLSIPVKGKAVKEQLESLTDCKDPNWASYIINNFNVSSPAQIKSTLNLLGFKLDSTGEGELINLNSEDPIIKTILDYRGFMKKATSFGQKHIDMVNPVTGRLHARLNQLRADSGRFSCEEPNLQQIVGDENYRKCFIAPEGKVLITADYSQQELRLAGALTQEPKFIETYKNNGDIHTLTASGLYNVPVEEVKKEQRKVAKGYNFAILYGSTEYGLAYTFHQKVEEARVLRNNFLSTYPTLALVMVAMQKKIVEKMMSITMFGRKRFFENKTVYTSDNPTKEYLKYIDRIQKEGFNHMIQGTGADVVKSALCKIFYNNPFGEDLKLILTVHDEIVSEVKESIKEEAKEFIKQCMLDAEQPFLGDIPAAVDVKDNLYWSK